MSITSSEISMTEYYAETRKKAISAAKRIADVKRESKGGVKIPATELNPSSRGDNFNQMLLKKKKAGRELYIGMKNPDGQPGMWEDHPDGHKTP